MIRTPSRDAHSTLFSFRALEYFCALMDASDDLYVECGSLRRDAGSLERSMGNADTLTGVQHGKANRRSGPVGKGGSVCGDIACLAAAIREILRDKGTAVKIDQNNPSGRHKRGRFCSPLDRNEKCVGLGRNTSRHAGGEDNVYQHTGLQTAQTHVLAAWSENAGIFVYI